MATERANPWDDDVKLQVFRLKVDSKTALPPILEKHIREVIKRKRSFSSPNAKKIKFIQPIAANENELSGMEKLATYLLFAGEAEGGDAHVHRVQEASLSSDYLPPPPNQFVKDMYTTLTKPRPDLAVGYITVQQADQVGIGSPFDIKEEEALLKDALMANLHFPFLTCQWKAAKSGQGHWHAARQGARDGATIMRYLACFYRKARITPSVVDTCHWSLTCDMSTVLLYVHWLETNTDGETVYHMKCVQQEFLNDLEDTENSSVALFRQRLHNIKDYALGERLDNIKAAIPKIKAGFKPVRKTPRDSKASSSKAPSSVAQQSDEGFYQNSELPKKKRPRPNNAEEEETWQE
jgi:hypothetical protein